MPGVFKVLNAKMEAVYDVLIDSAGKFNYILCRIHDVEHPEEAKYIVRGTAQNDVEYHCKCMFFFCFFLLFFLRAHPSLGMTMTQGITDLFLYRSPFILL